jgi:RimJ/RimL family protein N-acetyltransferase
LDLTIEPSGPFPAAVPILDTPRLHLRGHRVDDLPASAAMWAHPAVTRYIGGHPQTSEECWSRILRHAGHWSLLGYGGWVVEERTGTPRAPDRNSQTFVGEVGFLDLQREMDPPLSDGLGTRIEVGWVLSPSHQGKGYATEAVQAALAWGRAHFSKHLQTTAFTCIIDPENTASLRVAERCGFQESHRALYRGSTVIVFTANL